MANEEFKENKYVKGAKQRITTIRLRTWTLTLAIIVALLFYFLITITTRDRINWVDFLFLCIVQVLWHILYFPDGDLFGQKDKTFINNKNTYNEKANTINKDGKFHKLREYCKEEYEERKKNYIQRECSVIGITEAELEILKQKTEEEIKQLKTYEVKEMVDGKEKTKLIIFTKAKRRRLQALLFDKLPVEENQPETIMSAIEIDTNRAIKDNSKAYKKHSYIRKIMQAVIIGGIFAYIGYTLRDGIGLEEVVSIIMYLTTLFATAVISFTSGETCSKVHRSQFYLELSNFIDCFNEWETQHKVENTSSSNEAPTEITICPKHLIDLSEVSKIDIEKSE